MEINNDEDHMVVFRVERDQLVVALKQSSGSKNANYNRKEEAKLTTLAATALFPGMLVGRLYSPTSKATPFSTLSKY